MPLEPPMANPGPIAPVQGVRPGQPTMPGGGMGPIAPVGGPMHSGGPVMAPGGPAHTGGPAFVGQGMRHMGDGRAAHAPDAMPHGVLPWSNGGRY